MDKLDREFIGRQAKEIKALKDRITVLNIELKGLKENRNDLLGIAIDFRKTLVPGGLELKKPDIKFIDSVIKIAEVLGGGTK